MRWSLLLPALLTAMAAAASVAVIMDTMDTVDTIDFMGEPSTALGTAHPQYPTLLQGDPGATGHERMLPAVWACGVLMLAFAAALMAWGLRRNERSGWPAWALAACFVLQAGLFSVAMLAYVRFMGDPSPPLWWALPLPTAWLVYVFWPAQLVFVVLFVVTFDRWFWTPLDEATFRRIVSARHGDRNGTA